MPIFRYTAPYIARYTSYVLAMACMVACTSTSDSPATIPSEMISKDADSPVPTATMVAVSNDEPMAESSGGTLRVEIINSLVPDPVIDYGEESALLHSELFSGLTTIIDRPEAPIELELAERYSVSNGGLVYEFTLRRDLKFSDGDPVTAADVAWSWSRALSPSSGSVEANNILGGIEGAEAVTAGETPSPNGLRVVDDRTLRVTLSRPMPTFLANLAHPVASVLNPENVAEWGADFSILATSDWGAFNMDVMPAGTGPFMLVEYDFDSATAAIVRNPHYRGTPPSIERVEFVSADAEEIDLFELEEVDVTFYFPDLETAISGASTIVPVPEPPGTAFLAFNTASPPFDDVRFRRALLSSAEPSRVDFARDPAMGLLNPELPGASPDVSPPPYDPQGAARMLDEIEHVNGSTLDFHDFGEISFADEFELLASAWEDHLGLEFNIYRMASEVDYRNAIRSAEVQIAYREISATHPSQITFVQEFLDIFRDGPDSPEQDALTDLVEAALSETDAARTAERLAEIDQYVSEQAMILPLFWTRSGDGSLARVQPWVDGFEMSAYHSGSVFSSVSLTDNAPSRVDLP